MFLKGIKFDSLGVSMNYQFSIAKCLFEQNR